MPDHIAGDVDYSALGSGYSQQRKPDPRIEARIHAALANAKTVLNVGAGAGSYEPLDRHVIAIEPSAAMRRQRPPHRVPAIDAVAESLPLDDQSVDAAMAIITVHQWKDRARGLHELLRVTRGPIVLLAFDGPALGDFWLAHYCPQLIEADRRRDPPVDELLAALSPTGRAARAEVMPIPRDCTDGFTEAFYARPERLLDPAVTRAQSAWTFVSDQAKAQFARHLRHDLDSGEWDRRFGHHRDMPEFHGALRLIVSTPT